MRSAASISLAVFTFLLALVAVPASASAAGKARLDGVERSVVRAVNAQRTQRGLARVRSTHGLSRAANFHSRQMLRHDFFAHGAMEQRLRRYVGYSALGETLAYVHRCQGAARLIVRMWMNSPGHRAILLSPTYRRIGVGRRTGQLRSQRTCMVTADFASLR